MTTSTTRTTLILLLIVIGMGIVGRMDYEDALMAEQAAANEQQTTEVAKR